MDIVWIWAGFAKPLLDSLGNKLAPGRVVLLLMLGKVFRMCDGGEIGPVTFPAFKAGDSVLRGSNGGFDSHTLPPITFVITALSGDVFNLSYMAVYENRKSSAQNFPYVSPA